MEILFAIVVWFFLSVAVGAYANRKGREGVLWMLFSLALSPLLGFAFVAALGDKERDDDDDDRIPCPYCAEDIKLEAIICPHCRTDLRGPRQRR